jgi:hypothetical protein
LPARFPPSEIGELSDGVLRRNSRKAGTYGFGAEPGTPADRPRE